jgi:succinate dehydrogenase / fumarate reductase cytochrome b subunit
LTLTVPGSKQVQHFVLKGDMVVVQDVREALMQGRNSDGKMVRRPLSPHLQVYRPQISSALSIFHRFTGIALSAGALLLALWLAAAATSPGAFSLAQALLDSILGKLVLFGFTLALFYHFCNGIRHLLWDAGYGFELPAMHRTGYAVLVATVGLSVLFWGIFLVVG